MVTVGVDEVGRGCWAGPLVVGAVVLERPIDGLKDSKLLSRSRREKLDKIIRLEARAFGLGWVSPAEIDELGLTRAMTLAIRRALEQIKLDYDEIIIDGKYNFLTDNVKAKTMIKADQLVPAVSAASIIAKVARDNFMIELADKYKNYGFDSHVGYGTAIHRVALAEFGPCELHRLSFRPIKEYTIGHDS